MDGKRNRKKWLRAFICLVIILTGSFYLISVINSAERKKERLLAKVMRLKEKFTDLTIEREVIITEILNPLASGEIPDKKIMILLAIEKKREPLIKNLKKEYEAKNFKAMSMAQLRVELIILDLFIEIFEKNVKNLKEIKESDSVKKFLIQETRGLIYRPLFYPKISNR